MSFGTNQKSSPSGFATILILNNTSNENKTKKHSNTNNHSFTF